METQLTFDFSHVPQQLLTPDELFAGVSFATLREWDEDARFEKKPAMIAPKDVGDYAGMWANTAPQGGIIVVGITKDRIFEGCSKLTSNKLNDLEKALEIYCPDAVYSLKRVPIKRDNDGQTDFVLVFRVCYHPTRVVKTVKGEIFIRRGDFKMELRSTDEIRQLQSDKGEVTFESEKCQLPYPGDFDMARIANFAETVRTTKVWNAELSTEEILNLMHLGTNDGKFVPNVACALLFARDPRSFAPGCRIRFLRFEGEEEGSGAKWNAVKDDFVDGNIPTLLHGAEILLKSQLRTFIILPENWTGQ